MDRAPNSPPGVGLQELWRQVVAGFVVVPCVAATDTNVISLTPRLHREGGVTYGDGMLWSFTADATSSGSVTAAVGDLPALKVYTNSGALQAGAGVIVSASKYILVYDPGLDTGAGGFVVVGSVDGFGRGAVVQSQRTSLGTVATGVTAIPGDNSIPQSSEGDEYLSQAITPTNASNLLRVRAQGILTNSNANVFVGMALFQDAIADALVAVGETIPTAGHIRELAIDYTMVAGGTSPITFKIRAGASTGATTTLNGTAGVQIYGGAFNSFIQIDEIVA